MSMMQESQATTPRLDEVVIVGRADSWIGLVDSATQGAVDAAQLAVRPLSRTAELLECVPGLIVTQHSGAGKANQYFLRGFNLDHGTDLSVSFEGTPLNLPSHGHGQGYTDLNFLMPELVERVSFRKGPYFADVGDFGSAGAVEITYVDTLERPILRGQFGADDYARGFVADSHPFAEGRLLVAFDVFQHDGPWTNPDDLRRFNGMAKWSRGSESEGLSVALVGMDSQWNATDQIPSRAVASNLLNRYDAVDPTDGGAASQISAIGEWHHATADSSSKITGFARHSDLELYSNFSYFLDDPVNGDQFAQLDERNTYGLDARHELPASFAGRPMEHSFGLQLREDHIDNGLSKTKARALLSKTREDQIDELSVGAWYQNELEWNGWFRTVAGLRGDAFEFDVDSDDIANSGEASEQIASAKLSLIFGPWAQSELYLNAGQGFHSNDARGVTTTIDPVSANAVAPVDPLVRTEGAELGLRSSMVDGLESSFSVWLLDSDSEIVFVGDAGTTEPSRPSRRFGVEWTNDWRLGERWVIDFDAAWSRARFRDSDPAGDHVPGALRTVLSAGLTWMPRESLSCALRARHFGPRDVIEDASERSSESTLVNFALGWRVDQRWSVELGVFNLFDERANDIEYLYDSQLQGEPAPVSDVHFHPAERRTLRLGIEASW